MASASSLLSEEQFLCCICLDVFTDPISTPCGHNYCKTCITHYWNTNGVCQCPLCKRVFRKRPEVFVNTFISELVNQFRSHKLHQTVSLKGEYGGNKSELGETEVQQMIQERQVKIHEVKHSVELSKKDADREIADSVQVFTALMSCMEKSQAELIDVIEEKQKATEKQAEGFIKELQQEITELKKRSSELQQLSHIEDQNITSINTPPRTKDWRKVSVPQSPHVGTVRTAVAHLEKTLRKELVKLCDAELRRIQQHAVDVTLDSDTANPYLILSEDRKQVKDGDNIAKVTDNTERFSQSLSVLGKQSFSSGRFYYEVQVRRKTRWGLGVARESINKKGVTTVRPDNGYWTICLNRGNEYAALDCTPILLPVREKLQTVGVFVDYEEGLVSFYDVEARVHLYSFTGCTFTEKLYPIFCPAANNGGNNSAPLIISPVNLQFT